MCGLVGVITGAGRASAVDARTLTRMRDTLTDRGPDDAGNFMGDGVAIGHRRLAIIDPGPEGHQPMTTPDGRWTIAYNGELYNDAEVRGALESLGVRFRMRCDTETVLRAVEAWGAGARNRLRGMYAIAAWDAAERRLLLGRDPLGVKPLHVMALGAGELVFGSEPKALLAHPVASAAPDLITLSAYLTNVRTTLDDRTMFEGVRTLRPGEWLVVDASGADLSVERSSWWDRDRFRGGHVGERDDTRGVVEASVLAHLRSDVPLCGLLSGGLDSSAILRVASRHVDGLRSYCAGADTDEPSDDFSFAREAAAAIGTAHTEVVVTREGFVERWRWLVERNASPLSTPNEVAIYEVAAALRREGHKVTLSGEGADELFGGYGLPLGAAARWIASTPADADGGAFEIDANAWVPPAMKGSLLRDDVLRVIDGDAALRHWYAGVYRDGLAGTGDRLDADGVEAHRLDAHRHVHQRINLEGLLRRLDTSTMAASVEGRTPLADQVVALHAASLPMARKFRVSDASSPGDARGTKIALREAFAGDLPGSIVSRPKASFPLPFQTWVGEAADELRRSALARAVLRPEAIEQLAADPTGLWNVAWPAINVAMWGRGVWG